MKQEQKQEIALLKYSVIAPLVSGVTECSNLSAFFREASTKKYPAPDGTTHSFAPGTIKKWYLIYKNQGFDALMPQGRSDAGKSRKMDADIQEQVRYLKTNYPRLSAAAIYRQLKSEGTIIYGQLSESTVCRYINQFLEESKQTTNKDMRRYERPHINEVWCGDSSVGPYLKTKDGTKKRVYIIALIDDASRFIVGIDIFYNDNFVNLMSVMKSAVSKFGRPQKYNFDNGKNYKNKQMELLAARVGTTLHYNPPYNPTGKAKIERWFLTMKNQWMAALNMKDFDDISQLRESLQAYIQIYNQAQHSSLKGKTPQERFFEESHLILRLKQEELEKAFLLEVDRRVSADSVIVIDKIEYEVDYRFAKRRIKLRYSPDLKEIYVVETDGMLTPIKLLNKQDNSEIKREKTYLYQEEKK